MAACAAFAIACEEPLKEGASPLLAIEQPVINGEDDRKELFELAQADQRDSLARSVAALMWAHRIDFTEPGVLRAVSLRQATGACLDERFLDQPAAAFCSATLIDDDLVLTAGHCSSAADGHAAERCQRLLIVFGYGYVEEGQLALRGDHGVYTCRGVVHSEKTLTDAGFADLAVLQLDRPVAADLTPAVVAETAPRLGDAVLAASHGAGLPLKVDAGGEIAEILAGGDYFVASTDSFGGGSGSPLFNAEMGLVGHQVRGSADWEYDADCVRAARASEPREEHQLVTRSIRALCERGWPSERLCGHAAECGDGLCSGRETASSCPLDCKTPRCGDGLCEVGERQECDMDCRAYSRVPADWMQDPASYEQQRQASSAPAPQRSQGCSISRQRDGRAVWLCPLIALCGALLRRSLRERRAPPDRR